MRPRHKAAENGGPRVIEEQGNAASMRPRHKAAENPAGVSSWRGSGPRFNEAAA